MKRNNIFMWAYISFIIISIILRMFVDFELWESIILAITTSGIFFAIEDLYVSLSRALGSSIEIAESFISEAREKINKDLAFFAVIDEKTMILKNTKHDISDIQCSIKPFKEFSQEMNKCVCDFEEQLSIKKKSKNRYEKIANIFTYLGFLCLLCTMIIASFVTVPILIQELLTVLPFAIILITQQVNNNASERINNETISSKNALQMQESARNELNKYKNKFDYLINLIEENKQNTEENNNAD